VNNLAVDSLVQERFRTDGGFASSDDLAAAIEALLIVAIEPPTVAELAEALETGERAIEQALAQLQNGHLRGFILQRHGDAIRLTTAPRYAEQVRRFLGLERQAKLSAAALETLAIVAYRQPVSRAEIEMVRGVDCTGVLATLLSRTLIENVQDDGGHGKPYLYATTPEFLMRFGLQSLAELPDLGTVNGHDAMQSLTDLMIVPDEITEADFSAQ